jgi:hypothetical protein
MMETGQMTIVLVAPVAHALILRLQALLLPFKVLVFSGNGGPDVRPAIPSREGMAGP